MGQTPIVDNNLVTLLVRHRGGDACAAMLGIPHLVPPFEHVFDHASVNLLKDKKTIAAL